MVETFYRSREPKLGEKNPEPVKTDRLRATLVVRAQGATSRTPQPLKCWEFLTILLCVTRQRVIFKNF